MLRGRAAPDATQASESTLRTHPSSVVILREDSDATHASEPAMRPPSSTVILNDERSEERRICGCSSIRARSAIRNDAIEPRWLFLPQRRKRTTADPSSARGGLRMTTFGNVQNGPARTCYAGKCCQKLRSGPPISGVEGFPETGARWTLNRV